ncbi:sperm-associated microtubule inner protein 4 [Brachyhypopomus gauderio]|uniref:sperm-associated microtubule inner protein 4 n=1 Tax=Brachyhypopomus gauderio TaxID=698409 RepID=UPI0040435FE0
MLISIQMCIKYIKVLRSITIEQYYDLTPIKKSHVRSTDELIPKPTDINIGENLIKVSVPREHPYQSHISHCSIFPTYQSPDDPEVGVRAASRPPLNPLLPASAPPVTLLKKTKGTPYRHELLDVSMATRRNVPTWPGQNGFQNYTKPVKGETQMFYPKPTKTLCPNLSLRSWSSTLSERTANVLRNLEKAQWLSTYQLHYTGTGPAGPIKLDDFNEKTISLITGTMNPYTTQLRERSHPTLLLPRPMEGRKARILQNRRPLESTYLPPGPHSPLEPPGPPGLLSTLPAPQATAERIPIQDCIPGEQQVPHIASIESEEVKATKANQSGQPWQVARRHPEFASTDCVCEVCCETDCACRPKPSESDAAEPQATISGPVKTGNETENSKLEPFYVQNNFQSTPQEKELRQRNLSNCGTHGHSVGQNPFGLLQLAPPTVGLDRSVRLEQQEKVVEEEEMMKTVPRIVPRIQPRQPSAPCHTRLSAGERDARSGLFHSQCELLDLQHAFSRTEAHRSFHESLHSSTVDLRDNRCTGRKHSFFGFNSYYFHN